jgi:hypothetical protein
MRVDSIVARSTKRRIIFWRKQRKLSEHGQVRRKQGGRWTEGANSPRDRLPHNELSSGKVGVDRRNLLALGVVAGLLHACAALAARRSVPANTAALTPDGRALEK